MDGFRSAGSPLGNGDEGVEGNSRLTAGAGAVLFTLLAAEGATILRVGALLSAHVFVGVLLIPPLFLKLASAGWRFVRYYRGSLPYVRKGPPPPLLRTLAPMVVALTIVVLASGVSLLFASRPDRHILLEVHQASFLLWFAVMAVHVLGHLGETARLAPADWARRPHRRVVGAGARRWLLVGSLAVGVLLGMVMLSPASRYLPQHSRTNSATPVTHLWAARMDICPDSHHPSPRVPGTGTAGHVTGFGSD